MANSESQPMSAENDSVEQSSFLVDTVRRFLKHKLAVGGLIVLILLTLVAVFAPYIAPHHPNEIPALVESDSPTWAHPLGLDQLGRDNLSRLIFGTRISLSVGFVAVTGYIVIGTILGAIGGYLGGWIDIAVTRLTDTVLAFPRLMLILVTVSFLGPSIWNVMLILGLLGWPATCRIVRGEFMSLKDQEFVHAARASGASTPRIMFKHILPNAMAPILVTATFGIATAILIEASLSFLGMGVQPPTPSWGNMLQSAQSLSILNHKPYLWIPPGLMILIAVLSFNFVGDGLRDALDPKLKD